MTRNASGADRDLGRRVRGLRIWKGYTQDELAKLIGVSVGTVRNIEHGRTVVSATEIESIARVLRRKLEDFYAPLTTEQRRCIAMFTDSKTVRIFRILSEATPEELSAIEALFRDRAGAVAALIRAEIREEALA